MKKAFVLICILILMLCSCASTETQQPITPENADYALHIAGTESLKNAAVRLKNTIEKTFDTMPEEYHVLEENRYDIPGLNTILASWDSYIRTYLSVQCSEIDSNLIPYMDSLVFEDPVMLVSSSNTSVSTQFENLYRNNVRSLFEIIVNSADYSKFEKALKQYNSYIASMNFLYKTQTPNLNSDNIKTYFISTLLSAFTDHLRTSEELYRTTPDPYKDNITAVVFAVE